MLNSRERAEDLVICKADGERTADTLSPTSIVPEISKTNPQLPPTSALYQGHVGHHRYTPKTHSFRYPLFHAFVDLDHLDDLCEVSPFLSRNGFNWASIHDSDYLPDRTEATLRQRFDSAAREAGYEPPKGPVFLLANLRYFGFCFNPVAYYYAYDTDGRLALICAEITNTPWKERHRYWMVPTDLKSAHWLFEMPKVFHVSPFMPMDLRYRWTFSQPGENLHIHMDLLDQEKLCFEANLALSKSPWRASEIHRTLVRFPWVTLKVLIAIYWEALCLWTKRVPVFTHPKMLTPPEG